jgi:hypothetical protein
MDGWDDNIQGFSSSTLTLLSSLPQPSVSPKHVQCAAEKPDGFQNEIIQ